MNTSRSETKSASLAMTLQKYQLWHRYLGILAALFAVILSTTGLLLNHVEDLGLDEITINQEWVLSLYDMSPVANTVSFPAGNNWVSISGSRLYLDAEDSGLRANALGGVVLLDEFLLLAVDGGLVLLTRDGEIVERLPALKGVETPATGLGLDQAGNPVIMTAAGNFSSDRELTDWQATGEKEIAWSVSEPPPETLARDLLEQYRGSGLSLEKLVLDLHSGAILGKAGKYLVDMVAILFLFLSFSGLWVLWLRRKLSIALEAQLQAKKL